jgi:hypothetical protein
VEYITDLRWWPANLGYHVNIVLFADTQMLRRGVVAFESLPELQTRHASGRKTLEIRMDNMRFQNGLRIKHAAH